MEGPVSTYSLNYQQRVLINANKLCEEKGYSLHLFYSYPERSLNLVIRSPIDTKSLTIEISNEGKIISCCGEDSIKSGSDLEKVIQERL